MTESKSRHETAMAYAKDYARLIAAGDDVAAQGVAATLDDLVGDWRFVDEHTELVWPQAVADAAGVPVVRRREEGSR